MYAAYFRTRRGLKRTGYIFKSEQEARKYSGFVRLVVTCTTMKTVLQLANGELDNKNVLQLIKGAI